MEKTPHEHSDRFHWPWPLYAFLLVVILLVADFAIGITALVHTFTDHSSVFTSNEFDTLQSVANIVNAARRRRHRTAVSKKKPVATSSVIASGFHLTFRTGQRLLPPA